MHTNTARQWATSSFRRVFSVGSRFRAASTASEDAAIREKLLAKAKQTKSSSVVLLVPAVVTFGCGIWQLQRMRWKQDLRDARVEALTKNIVHIHTLEQLKQAVQGTELVRVMLHGTWQPEKNILVGPRSRPMGGSARANAHSPTGFHSLTPLVLEDGTAIIVNRGWIPADMKDSIKTSMTTEAVCVDALLREDDKPHGVVPPNEPSSDRWFSIDSAAMCKHIGVPFAPVFEQISEETHGKDYPLAKRMEDLIGFSVNPIGHAGYAATWFSLSAVTLGLSVYIRRQAARMLARIPKV